MQRRTVSAVLIALLVLATLSVTPLMAQESRNVSSYTDDVPADKIIPKDPDVRIDGEYIVVLKEGTDPDKVKSRLKGRTDFVYRNALAGFAGKYDKEDLDLLASLSEVIYIEENAVYTTAETQQLGATWGLDRAEQRFLDLDGEYWHYIDQDNPPGVATTRAYVIDTGILPNHTEFAHPAGGTRLATGPGDTFTSVGVSWVDCNGHGTHVSGTLGGLTYGVSKQVTLHPVRVLNCGGFGTLAGVLAGVNWVTANHKKPAVANMSIQGPFSPSLNTGVDNSVAAGVFYAIAAGNFNSNACSFSPSSAAQAYTVAATDQNDNRASFSNFGTCVDIFAPGVSITSAWHTPGTSAINTINGTSMSSPHVAGSAALYLAEYPWATPAQVRAALDGTGTTNVVTNPGFGSPNLMLYTRADSLSVDFSGNMTILSQQDVHPNGVAYYANLDGPHEGLLSGPAGSNFDLSLFKFDPVLGIYLQVATSAGVTSDEHVIYHGTPGLYYWSVFNSSGTGTYTLRASQP